MVLALVLQLSGRGIALLPARFRFSGYLAGELPGFRPGSGFPVIWPENCPASSRVPVFWLSGQRNCPASGRVPVFRLSGQGIARLPARFRFSSYLAGELPGFRPSFGFLVIWPGNCPASGRVPVFRSSGRGIARLPAGFRFSGYLARELPGFRLDSGFPVIWPGNCPASGLVPVSGYLAGNWLPAGFWFSGGNLGGAGEG